MVRVTCAALAVVLFLVGWNPPGVWAQDDSAEVRVRLLEDAQVERIEVEADGGALHLYTGDAANPLASLGEGESVAIARRGEELRVDVDDAQLFVLELGLLPDDDTQLKLRVEKAGRTIEPRTYEGRLVLRPDVASPIALRMINHVPLENYVASVVSSEYGFDDVEGAKAMAVLVRTYALRNKFGEEYDHVDHVISQAYRGTTELTTAAVEATRQTRGQVLTHADSLIEAVYFSSSGGYTANNEDVWDGRPLPYLRGRDDPYDSASPHTEWRTRASRRALLNALSSHYGISVRGFVIADRSDEGRVRTVELLTDGNRRPVRANEFRMVANRYVTNEQIRSTFFEARRDGDDYVFTGRGFGHGVGLSQYGARELSREGRSYEEILDFYFSDVSLQHLDGLDQDFDMPLLAETPPVIEQQEIEESEEQREAVEEEGVEERTEPRRTRRIGW